METTPAPFGEAFDAVRGIRHGWSAFKRYWPVLFVGGCLKNCTEGGGGTNFRLPSGFDADDNPLKDFQPDAGNPTETVDLLLNALGMGFIVTMVVVGLAVVLGVLLLRAWLLPGWIRVHREILETGRAEWATLFSGGDRFLPMLGWTFLSTLVIVGTYAVALTPALGVAFALHFEGPGLLGALLLGLFCLLVPAIYVSPGLAFGAHALVLDDLPVMDALGRSWELAAGNRMAYLVYAFFMGLMRLALAVVGLCMLCVGVIVANPLSMALKDYAFTEAYLVFTRGWAARENWKGWDDLER